MRKKQAGQVFIWVLMLLAVGSLVAVPSLRLTDTALKSSQIVDRQTKGLYAADAAQEYILWKLRYAGFGGEFENDGDTIDYKFYVCDVPVSATVIMRAKEGEGGTTLATDDKIMATKEVTPSYVDVKREELYTYTINLDYLSDISEENPQVYLDAIYDIPPGGFRVGAYEGPTEISLDGGVTWQVVPDPEWNHAKGYLKWPADYNKYTGEGAFSSHPEFRDIQDFEVREVKKLRFQMRGTLGDDQVHCNWVVLKMEDNTNTLSGPQAPIKVGGDPDMPGVCEDSSVMAVSKTSDPEIIQPGVETPVVYTLSITNMYTQTRSIGEVTDYLPPDFEYVEIISSELLNPSEECQILELDPLPPLGDPERSNPLNDISLLNINGIDRQQLRWRIQKFPNENDISMASGQTLKLTFRALATKDVSGTYYNEVIVLLREAGISSAFEEAGVLPGEYGSNYSWLTGAVIVPAYDCTSEAEGVTINANMALIELGGITITSWQVY